MTAHVERGFRRYLDAASLHMCGWRSARAPCCWRHTCNSRTSRTANATWVCCQNVAQSGTESKILAEVGLDLVISSEGPAGMAAV